MSRKFKTIYESLPLEAQQLLVEKHLSSLLQVAPKDKAKKVLAAATRLQKKYDKAPQLNLRSKRKQIGDLLDELTRDAKTSMIKERSNREELLSEIVHSLTGWLNDIWSVAYEYNAHFFTAHTCLLFSADALVQLSENSMLGGCKCLIMNLPVDFTLKDKKGKVMRRFSVRGPQNIDKILLWIWRDLFISLLLSGSERDKARIPDFLEDIQLVLGVEALEKILYGGVVVENDDESDYEDCESLDDEDGFEEYDGSCLDDSDRDTDDSDSRCPCNLHAHYWTETLNRKRLALRDHVQKKLLNVFKEAPSLRISNALKGISADPHEMDDQIITILDDIAGSTPENLVAALEISIADNNYDKIVELFDLHGYLLRPRDMTTLQCAVTLLDESDHQKRALSILEQELEDSLAAIYHGMRTSFAFIEEETNKLELTEILKLKTNSTSRKSRIEAWAETVVSSPANPMHPMAFAAMMMGLPMVPGVDDGEESDILNYVDLDPNDQDFDDLREEYRPNLKARFDGWVHVGSGLNGGPAVLSKLYQRAIQIMPFLQGQDIVTEMATKLRERPNRTHILDALNSIATFSRAQRKRSSLEKKKLKTTTTTIHRGKNPNASPVTPSPPSSPPHQHHSHDHSHPNHPAPTLVGATFGPFVFGVGPGGQFQVGTMQQPPAGAQPEQTSDDDTPNDYPIIPGGMEDVD